MEDRIHCVVSYQWGQKKFLSPFLERQVLSQTGPVSLQFQVLETFSGYFPPCRLQEEDDIPL